MLQDFLALIYPRNCVAFGAPMPGRNYQPATPYKYGFNGQLKDDEVYGAGNLNSAEFWEYDTRLGRRWETDPIVKSWESPYATFSDNPIMFIDPFGLDSKDPKEKKGAEGGGTSYSTDNNTRTNGNTKQTFNNECNCYLNNDVVESANSNPVTPESSPSKPSSENGFFTNFYGMAKYAGNNNPYMYNNDELNRAANIQLALALSFIPGGQIGGLGRVGGFVLKGAINSSIDFLGQKATGQNVNITSVGTSFIFQGGLGSILSKNIISSSAQFYFEDGKLNHKIVGIDHTDIGAVAYNATLGSAFDFAFFRASSLNVKVNNRYTTRLQNLATKPKYAMELMNYRSTMFYKNLLKNTASSNISDFGKGVIVNEMSKEIK